MQILLQHRAFAYDDDGDGPPIVFIHGFPHDRTLWAHQRAALASRARVIVPDLCGFGESAAEGVMTVERYADDIIALLDVLAIERAVVCGLSMGGYIAMAMWRRAPQRISGLVFCDTKAAPDNDAGRAARDETITFVQQAGAGALAERQLPKMLGTSTHARRPEVVDAMRSMMTRQSVDGIVAALGALRDRPDSRETVQSISVPTLVVVGDDDQLTPLSDAQALIALLPPSAHARLEIIEDSGHAVCVERPSAVTHVISEFLNTLTDTNA